MHCTGNTVALQTRKTEAFGHNTLTGKGSIAVQKQRQNLGAFSQRNHIVAGAAYEQVLLGTGLAHHNRIDDFKVRRVGGQRQMDLVTIKFAIR